MLHLALLSSLAVAGSDPCSSYKVTEDQFGGGSNVEATVQLITQFTPVSLIFQVKSGVGELLLTVKEGGAISAGVPAGVEVPFKLEDGTILKLKTVRDTATKPYVSGDSIMTLVPYSLGVSASDVAKFAESPLVAARLPLSSGPYDWSANKGVQKSMTKAATCVRNHVVDPVTSAPAAGVPADQ